MPGFLKDKLHVPDSSESKSLIFWIGCAVVLVIVVMIGRKMAKDAPAPTTAQASTIIKPSQSSPNQIRSGMTDNSPSPAQRTANSISREFANAAPVDAFGNPVPQYSGAPNPQMTSQAQPPQQMPAYSQAANQEGGQTQDDSPVAVSYRQAYSSATAAQPGIPAATQAPVNELDMLRQLASSQQSAATAPQQETPHVKAAEDDDDVTIISGGRKDMGKGNRYVIPEGTWFQCTLINRLAGEYTGPVICGVAVDVWDHSKQHVLLPSGTPGKPGERATVIGESYQVGDRDQKRLAITFHQVTYWKGETRVRIPLDRFKGLDQAGETGVHDKVNNHWLQTFGVAAVIGVLGALSYSGTGSAITASGGEIYRQQIGASIGMEGEQILSRFLNRMPEITIREGHPINAYVGKDLWVPAVDEITEVRQ